VSLLTDLRRAVRSLPAGGALRQGLHTLIAQAFGLTAWRRYGRNRHPAKPRPGPVCVVGFHRSVLGIGEAARGYVEALRLAGGDVVAWDISALFGHEIRLDGASSADPPFEAAAMVLVLNPHELVQLVALAGAAPFRDRFCVGAWFWELETVPRSWRTAMRYVDEVWAASRFVADAVAVRAPPTLPIRVLPCPVPIFAVAPDRAALGLPEDKVVVLTAFDVRSGFARKNPIAAVRAFRQANADGRAVMVCKAAGIDSAPDLVDQLKAEIGEGGDVRVLTDWLTGAQMDALIASADIVLSLHRAEGFGLLPAQAMAAGKAVVATGWSSNVDFMTPADSMLVDYVLVPVQDPQGLYRGGRWAEPDIADAAAKLASLIADAPARTALGARARAAIAARLDPLLVGRQARAWLEPPKP